MDDYGMFCNSDEEKRFIALTSGTDRIKIFFYKTYNCNLKSLVNLKLLDCTLSQGFWVHIHNTSFLCNLQKSLIN